MADAENTTEPEPTSTTSEPTATATEPSEQAGADASPIDLSGDGGVLKTVLRASPDAASPHPPAGSQVHVHYVGTLKDTGEQFDSSRSRGDQFKFKIGAGQVIKAWDIGVASMRVGELSRLECRSDYAYGDAGSPPKIPGKATLIFEVELFGWDDPEPDTHQERLAAAEKRKEEGNQAFKEGDFVKAASLYEKAVGYFQYSWGLKDDEEKSANDLKLPCLLNLAMCQLKTGDLSDAAQNCSKALDIDNKNVKALFRRAKARVAMADFELAKEDLREAIKYAPQNRDLRTEFGRVKELEAQQLGKEREMAQRAFAKGF